MRNYFIIPTRKPGGLLAAALLILTIVCPGGARAASEDLAKGVDAVNQRNYTAAVVFLKRAVDVEPLSLNARLHLANAYLLQASADPENRSAWRQSAREIYQGIAEQHPGHPLATWNLAVLALQAGNRDEAEQRCRELMAGQPGARNGYYTFAVIQFMRLHEARTAARRESGMAMSDPSPISNPAVRATFRDQHESVLEESLRALRTALSIDPRDENALLYSNLLLRVKADMAETKRESDELARQADDAIQQARQLQSRRLRGGSQAPVQAQLDPQEPPPGLLAPPPPPPTPPPPAGI